MSLTVLRPYYLIFRNRFRFRGRIKKGLNRDAMIGVVALLIMLSIFGSVFMGLRLAAAQPGIHDVLPRKLIELAAHYFFILLIVSNTVAATGNIYTSERMTLLLSAPLSGLSLFIAKFIELFLETGMMFYVFTGPAALAYLVHFDLPFSFFLSYLAISIPLLAIPTALGIILSTLFARLIAFFWRRGNTFVVLGFLIFTGMFIYTVTGGGGREALRVAGADRLADAVDIFERVSPPWSPSRWIADILLASFEQRPLNGINRWVLISACLCLITPIAFLLFESLMLRVRSALSTSHQFDDSGTGIRKGQDTLRYSLEKLCAVLPFDQQTAAIFTKDLSTLVRDRALSLQLVLYLGISSAYVVTFNFMSDAVSIGGAGGDLWTATLATLNTIFAALIFSTMLARLVYPAVSLEGRAFWVLQVTPIKTEQLLRAKVLTWLPLASFLLVSLIMAGAIAVKLTPLFIIYSGVVGLSFSIGCTGLAIGCGAKYANFDWEAPNQIAVSLGTLVLLFSNILLIFILSIPVALANGFGLMPDLRVTIGFPQSLAIMFLSIFSIVFLNLYVADRACRTGAQALDQERGAII